MEFFERFRIKGSQAAIEHKEMITDIGLIYDYEKKEFYNVTVIENHEKDCLINNCKDEGIDIEITYEKFDSGFEKAGYYKLVDLSDNSFIITHSSDHLTKYYVNYTIVKSEVSLDVIDLKKGLHFRDAFDINSTHNIKAKIANYYKEYSDIIKIKKFEDSVFFDILNDLV